MEEIVNKLSWVIGGAQGSGVDTAANIFAKACVLGGLHIYGKREYSSNIKGRHSYFNICVGEKPIRSHVDEIDLLVAFDAETLFTHAMNVVNGGAIVHDSSLVESQIDEVSSMDEPTVKELKEKLATKAKGNTMRDMLDLARDKGAILYPVEFKKLLRELAEKKNQPSLGKLMRMINVMALASSFALLDYSEDTVAAAIKHTFKAKPKIVEMNIEAANYAINHTKAKFGNDFRYKLQTRKVDSSLILIQGSQATALGKMVAGCRFQTYYPITPASDESEYIEANEVLDLVDGNDNVGFIVVQTEDEIAAITMATGAALSGTRSATCTSGPGFSLMAEGMGWAGISEAPVVITLYQRAGPATGLPTRHEQGDLDFAIHAGHGEFPRIVFASGDVEESFYDSIKVFNYAERYQTPVIHMVDKALGSAVVTIKRFDPQRIKIDRGLLIEKVDGNYKRFEFTESGVSPRVKIGAENGIFWNTGDEHEPNGHITEHPTIRTKMMDKRMGKLDLILNELPNEDRAVKFGEESDMTIISWGSTKGPILDAMALLIAEGKKINFIQVRLLNPFPTRLVESLLSRTRLLIDIEMNYSGQLANLISKNIKRDPDYLVVKYNGRPMSLSEVYAVLKKIIDGKANTREVLTGGT
ncbi:MAG: 2-oxoacid:ferredoxin oxidoreductase subunit alpha [Nitrososphaerales archaeon]